MIECAFAAEFVSYEEESLIYRKKIRTYSKHLVAALSIVSLMGIQ
ncbi:hypothetical protein wTpre_1100 [Wolbachia endosymbiont of Trichogramma pretiosum]|nr:hypothetical protein wTpre_1100 [Wolbachia endosymbiont of Trichogramma pretiosum]